MHESNREEANLTAFQQFIRTPLDERLARSAQGSPEEAALRLFQSVAVEVPAYGAFLETHGVDPGAIRTFEDFQTLPLVTKDNYIRKHPLPELCRGGELHRCEMIAVSSGSTGQPLFWPRALPHELDIASRFEQIFAGSFATGSRSTLAVVCFAMGTWVGGMFTASCCRLLAHKGYPITMVTPGTNRDEILRCVTELGPWFDQVVLLGYPPFLKDVIDLGAARGVEWKNFSIRLVMAGEVFSEEWRSLVGSRTGSTEPCLDSASLYGTADAGVLGCETPLSITIRRFLSGRPDAARELFGESRLPTLVQYDPFSRFFECRDGSLLFSGDSGVPLIRYHIADSGGIVEYEAMMAFVRDHGLEVQESALPGFHPLPFVFVFGRSDFTVSFYGAENIYPENITVGLEAEPISGWTSGKFVLQVEEDSDRSATLTIAVELLPGIEPTAGMRAEIARSIQAQLLRLNSEFGSYVPVERQSPLITLAPAGDPRYFPAGVKHRYTRPTAQQTRPG